MIGAGGGNKDGRERLIWRNEVQKWTDGRTAGVGTWCEGKEVQRNAQTGRRLASVVNQLVSTIFLNYVEKNARG